MRALWIFVLLLCKLHTQYVRYKVKMYNEYTERDMCSVSYQSWQCVLTSYVMLASVVGFYSLRCCSSMMPRRNDTPMTHIIFNCVVLLVLSSALPVLSRILGNQFTKSTQRDLTDSGLKHLFNTLCRNYVSHIFHTGGTPIYHQFRTDRSRNHTQHLGSSRTCLMVP